MKILIRLLDKMIVAQMVAVGAWMRRLRRARPEASAAPTWVAIKLAGMGDAVLMLPALAAIRATPGHRLIIVTTSRCAPVFAAPGIADQVIALRRGHIWRQGKALVAALRHCEGVLDFEQHVFWSCAVALLARRRALLHGFKTGSRRRNLAYDRKVEVGTEPRHMKEIFDELARSAGFHPAAGLRALPVRASAEEGVNAWLKERGLRRGEYAVMAPGSGATVAFRRLQARDWGEIIAAMPPAVGIVLAGTAIDAALIEEIEREVKRPVAVQLRFDLEQLASLLAGAARVVAIDSGPMHLAAAMGCAVVGIFGPDTPRRYGPYNPHSAGVSLHLDCSPCNNCFIYREARCCNPDQYACLRRMPMAMVAEAGNRSVPSAPAERSAISRSATGHPPG